jgi:hypothetical protein
MICHQEYSLTRIVGNECLVGKARVVGGPGATAAEVRTRCDQLIDHVAAGRRVVNRSYVENMFSHDTMCAAILEGADTPTIVEGDKC